MALILVNYGVGPIVNYVVLGAIALFLLHCSSDDKPITAKTTY